MNEPTKTLAAAVAATSQRRQPQPTTEEALLQAFAELIPLPKVVFEYRVYYEPITRECTTKSINHSENIQTDPFIVVTRDQYDAIEFCPNYYITPHGKIERKAIDSESKIRLQLNPEPNPNTKKSYETIRDNIIFRVDEGYLNDTDCWSLRDFNATY